MIASLTSCSELNSHCNISWNKQWCFISN